MFKSEIDELFERKHVAGVGNEQSHAFDVVHSFVLDPGELFDQFHLSFLLKFIKLRLEAKSRVTVILLPQAEDNVAVRSNALKHFNESFRRQVVRQESCRGAGNIELTKAFFGYLATSQIKLLEILINSKSFADFEHFFGGIKPNDVFHTCLVHSFATGTATASKINYFNFPTLFLVNLFN